MSARHRKLADQLPETSDTHVLRNVRVYINGYLDNTTDIEMKRIVTLAGGQVMCVSSFDLDYADADSDIGTLRREQHIF